MLKWISGAPGSVAERDEPGDRTVTEEPPGTPAHLFAVKAFKTDLFGTPAPVATVKPKKTTEAPKPTASEELDVDRSRPVAIEKDSGPPNINIKKADLAASPAKGILLTPGTAPVKRKTVSFSEMASKHRDAIPAVERDVETPLGEKSSFAAQDNVRRKLFQKGEQSPTRNQHREQPLKMEDSTRGQSLDAFQKSWEKSDKQEEIAQEPSRTLNRDTDSSHDITVDLQQPRSRSGKHWMQEYQREHDSSKVEMKNLIRHNKITKSFAEKRDQEATEFAEKLEDAEMKLKQMEQRVSGLAGQLMDERTQDQEQAEILNELASQTAQVLRYKQKAERYRAALWGEEHRKAEGSQRAEDNLRNLSALKSEEVSSLQSDLASLRMAKEDAEKRASRLVLENADLKEKLTKAEKEVQQLRAQERNWRQRHDEAKPFEVQQRESKLAEGSKAYQESTSRERLLEEREGVVQADKRADTKTQEPRGYYSGKLDGPHLDACSPLNDESQTSNSKRRRTGDAASTGYVPISAARAKTHKANQSCEPGVILTAEPPARRAVGNSKNDPLAAVRQPTKRRTSLIPDYDREGTFSGLLLNPVTPTVDLHSHRHYTEDNATGRRSPIIPESARNRELRHTKSTSSLMSEHRRRNVSDSSLGVVSGNARTGHRAGRPELPADRIAAAKKRLEEKAARRGDRGSGKENMRLAPAVAGLSSYYDAHDLAMKR